MIMTKCTFIDGIASSQALDTAGEIVDLKGLDVSSLVGAALNWEHKRDVPAQIVGKIVEVKKIFTESDCENQRHKYYWKKIKLPFLYLMGRLFDDEKPSAIEVAALFKDDARHPHEQDMLGFSVEGAKIEKIGAVITRSIGRLVTLAHLPANKTCISEIMPEKKEKADSSDISSLFKGEMELFQFEPTYVEIMSKKEVLEKGLQGDWQKEGYTLHHAQAPNGIHHVEAKDKHGNHAGAAQLHPVYDAASKTNHLHPGQVYTEDAHQRKGIASAMYRLAENKSGMKIHPSHQQTEMGRKFSQNRKSETIEKKETLKKDSGNGGGFGGNTGSEDAAIEKAGGAGGGGGGGGGPGSGAGTPGGSPGGGGAAVGSSAGTASGNNAGSGNFLGNQFITKRKKKKGFNLGSTTGTSASSGIGISGVYRSEAFIGSQLAMNEDEMEKSWKTDATGQHSMAHPSGHKFQVRMDTGGTGYSLHHTSPTGEGSTYRPFGNPQHAKNHAHGIIQDKVSMRQAMAAGSANAW